MDKATHNGTRGCLSDKHFLKPPSVAHSSRKGVLPILPPLTTIRFLGWQGAARIPTATCTFLPCTTTDGTAWNAIQVETRIPMRLKTAQQVLRAGRQFLWGNAYFNGFSFKSSDKTSLPLFTLPSVLCSALLPSLSFFLFAGVFPVSPSQVPF